MSGSRILIALLVLVAAVPARFVGSSGFAEEGNLEIVHRFVDAFNGGRTDVMLSLCGEEFRWMSVVGDAVDTPVQGKAALAASLEQMFEEAADSQSELLRSFASGEWVTTLERATWRKGDEVTSECSVGIYRLADGRISDVWYFAAHDCDEAQQVDLLRGARTP